MYQGLLALSPKVAILRMSKVYSVRWDFVEPDEAADLSDVNNSVCAHSCHHG